MVVDTDYDNFDNPSGMDHAPAAQPAELPEIKLFGRWSCDDVQVNDMSLQVWNVWFYVNVLNCLYMMIFFNTFWHLILNNRVENCL